MADDKWISGLRGDMPAAEAAQRVLAVRLGAVLDRLPGAVYHAEEDVEHVHQLRVGTRRAGAAVRIFADCLPAKLHRKTRKALRRIRRAAGAARDWDVFIASIAERLDKAMARQRPGLDFLLGFGHGQRVFAQEYLQDATAGQEENLRGLLAPVNDALGNDASAGKSLYDLAVPVLAELVRELEAAASGDLELYEALHQIRILGKQLRYAMEVFESCFAADFHERLYPQIVEMQDILGKANDSHVASLRLTGLRTRLERLQPDEWPGLQPAFTQLLRYHHRRLPEQRKRFLKWWEAWQSSGAAESLGQMVHAHGR
jgi:CHAD domain-containing protein